MSSARPRRGEDVPAAIHARRTANRLTGTVGLRQTRVSSPDACSAYSMRFKTPRRTCRTRYRITLPWNVSWTISQSSRWSHHAARQACTQNVVCLRAACSRSGCRHGPAAELVPRLSPCTACRVLDFPCGIRRPARGAAPEPQPRKAL